MPRRLGVRLHWRLCQRATTSGGAGNFLDEVGAYVTLADVENVGGLFFQAADTTIGGTGSSYGLNFGTNPFAITDGANTKQIIAVPIIGSGPMTISQTVNGGSQIDLAGDLSQFTGNIIVNNAEPSPSTSNANQLNLDSAPGNPAATIFLDQFVQLDNNQQVNDNGHSTSNNYTIPNNIVLNYNGTLNNVSDTLGCSASNVTGVEKLVNFSGNISSANAATIITNLIISGTNGCTTLSGSNSYTGSTTVNNSATTGMFRIGNSNSIPATTTLDFNSGGPMAQRQQHQNRQLGKHGAALTNNSATADGNIYNIFSNSGSETPVTITVTPKLRPMAHSPVTSVALSTRRRFSPTRPSRPRSASARISQ